MKKLLALALAGAMLLSLAACGGSESSGTTSGAASGGAAAAPAEGEATDTLHVILRRGPAPPPENTQSRDHLLGPGRIPRPREAHKAECKIFPARPAGRRDFTDRRSLPHGPSGPERTLLAAVFYGP